MLFVLSMYLVYKQIDLDFLPQYSCNQWKLSYIKRHKHFRGDGLE